MLQSLARNDVSATLEQIERSQGAADDALQAHYDVLKQQLMNSKEAVAQVIVTAHGGDVDKSHDAVEFLAHSLPVHGCISFSLNICHPFSRGRRHALTTDIHDAPSIDIQFFSHPADEEVCVHCVLHAQEL